MYQRIAYFKTINYAYILEKVSVCVFKNILNLTTTLKFFGHTSKGTACLKSQLWTGLRAEAWCFSENNKLLNIEMRNETLKYTHPYFLQQHQGMRLSFPE